MKRKRTTAKATRARRLEQDGRKAAQYSGGRLLRPDGLTDREALFIEEYCKDLNATQAAIRAGYAQRSAHVIASRLRNDKLRGRIEDRLAALKAKAQVSVEEVMERLTALARGNIGNFAQWDCRGVTLRDSSELTEAQKYAVAEVAENPSIDGEKMSKEPAVRIKLRDPLPALVHMARILGVLPLPGGVRMRAPVERRAPTPTCKDLNATQAADIVIHDGTGNVGLPDNERGDGGPPPMPLAPGAPSQLSTDRPLVTRAHLVDATPELIIP